MRAEAETPFDLARGPLLRVRLLKLGEREHVLLCTFHHIIFDGWSSAIFNRDLSAFYEAFRRGEDKPSQSRCRCSMRTMPFGSASGWRARSSSASSPTGRASWPMRLPWRCRPTWRVRCSRALPGGGILWFWLRRLTARLKELSRQENATLFMTLLAAFQLLLCRYSGQEDISVGIPAANRNHVELEELIGFFLDTLVLRTDLSGAPSFRELLRRVQKVTLEAYAHADVPFEKLVQELQPERSLNQTPLFQAFLNFLSFEDQPVRLAGLEAERCLKEGLKSKFDLTLYIREGAFGLYFRWPTAPSCFCRRPSRRMMRHFENLLEAIVADPEGRIGALPMLEAEERQPGQGQRASGSASQSLRALCPRGDRAIDCRRALPSRCARLPRALRCAARSCQWSYQELDERSEQIARASSAALGGDEQHIGLLLEHDAPMIAAALGVLKAGKAYVPLDGAYPAGRLTAMIADAQVRTIISDEANAALAQELSAAGISVLRLAELEAAAEGEQPLPLGSAEATAYLLYTSGSTGEPKAITQSHRNVLHHIASYTNSLHLQRRRPPFADCLFGGGRRRAGHLWGAAQWGHGVSLRCAQQRTGCPGPMDGRKRRSPSFMPPRVSTAILSRRSAEQQQGAGAFPSCAWWSWEAKRSCPLIWSSTRSTLSRVVCWSMAMG